MNCMTVGGDISPADLRKSLGSYCSGVTIVGGRDAEGNLFGMTCQSFHSLSLDPPLVAYFADRASKSYRELRRLDRFCISVLAADQAALASRFSRSGIDRWAGTEWSEDCFGQPVISGSIASISCRSYDEHEGGDHFINVSRVEALRHDQSKRPLLFFRSSFAHLGNEATSER
ncbi:MAG: flavin reductase family protein [Rhizobiales bacterium]|nr:flavin reductase family protein [Hyphomicrobiales bacterium]OJU34960.1 MAG: hypothetical protein BGN94_03510 [Rhizobiales bacterium 68-8]